MIKDNNEESSNSLVIFFKWFIKKTLWILLLVLSLFLLVGLYFLINNYLLKRNISNVTVNVKANPYTSCKNIDKPFEIEIINNTNKTIIKSYISLSVKKKGFSSELSDFDLRETITDKIIKPSEKYIFCTNEPLKGLTMITDKRLLKLLKENMDRYPHYPIKDLKIGDTLYLLKGYDYTIESKDFDFEN